ncbi:Myoneurin [Pseudolycoriella hygida]|uniref:Myoneurin n=1 Tax=Pseudolycoriella hygida TaxID=35572 RepID=A0A9Q0MMG7_9DIPT|nr:Myoneurin [Pseudolycoriella hygida]
MESVLKKSTADQAIDRILAEIAQILFKCKFCDFITDEKLLLITHYRSIHVKSIDSTTRRESAYHPSDVTSKELDERFVCSLCFSVFLSRELVKDHMITDHGCVPMANEADNQQQVHSKLKNSDIANSKKDVDKELHRPISLRELQLKLKSSFVLKCSVKGCSKRFESEESKSYHERCHTLINNEFKCFECQAVAKNWRNCSANGILVQIFRHLQVHGATKGFACSNCPKVFKQFSQLRVHGITHHQNDGTQMRWYSQKKCDICNNMFANSKVLSKHIKTVHNQIKPFICNVCGHKSARKVTHMIHLRQHTGEKPISCQYCKFKAADPSVIKKHELRHQAKDQWKYKCKDCDYISIQSSTMKSHLKKYHPNSHQAIQCEFCSFVSLNVNVLNRHKQSHKSLTTADAIINNSGHRSDDHLKREKELSDKPKRIVDVSSDCFLPLESTDSICHDQLVDTGGVTIPEGHTEETQFPSFSSD